MLGFDNVVPFVASLSREKSWTLIFHLSISSYKVEFAIWLLS